MRETTNDHRLVTFSDCSDPSHQMSFYLHEDDVEEPELYVHVQLNPRWGWWRRLRIATGYVLGRRSRYSYGHWDEGDISAESARMLIPMLGKFLNAYSTWEKSQEMVSTAGTDAVAGLPLRIAGTMLMAAKVPPPWRFDSTH